MAALVKSPWFLAGSALVAFLGLVAAIFGPAPELLKEQTKVSNFNAKPINKWMVTEFVLPLDAPLEEMPAGDSGYCSEPVIDWLKKVGTEIPPYQRISIQNTAEDGAMLAMSNVRAVDLRKYEPKSVIYFRCPDGGNGDNSILHLRLDRDPQAQLFDPETEVTGPFAFNLQPGEQGSIELYLLGDEDNSYSGRIVADISTGGRTVTVDLPLNGRADGFDRISPGKFARLVVSPGMNNGIFQCLLFESSNAQRENAEYDLIDCSPDQVRSMLAEIE